LIEGRIAHGDLLHLGLQAEEFAAYAHYRACDDVEQPPGCVCGKGAVVPPADEQMQDVESATTKKYG